MKASEEEEEEDDRRADSFYMDQLESEVEELKELKEQMQKEREEFLAYLGMTEHEWRLKRSWNRGAPRVLHLASYGW
jgi:hypothetical protein